MHTISYWLDGTYVITDHRRVAEDDTYELLDFEPPPKPIVPEVGKWYVVKLEPSSNKGLRQYGGGHLPVVDLDGNNRGMPIGYEFLEEWAPVKK